MPEGLVGQKIAERIDAAMKAKGWTVTRLIRITGLSTNAIYRMRHSARPRVSTVELIAAKLGVPAASLAPELIGEDPHTAAAVAHAGGKS